MKKFIYLTLPAMILLSGVTYVSAQDKNIEINNLIKEQKTETNATKDIIISDIKNNNEIYENDKNTRYSNLVISEDLYGSNGSAVYSFSVSKDQPFYRIYIENNGSSTLNVIVGGNSFSVNSGKKVQYVYEANPDSYGRRNIEITSKDGSSLSGKIAVRIASSLEELS